VRRLMACGLLALLAPGVASTQAVAAPVSVVIDDRSAELDEADDGWSVSLGFTNLTDDDVDISVAAGGSRDDGCDLVALPDRLPPSQRTDVKVTVSAGCDAVGGIDLKVTAEAGATVTTFDVKAAAPDEGERPPWAALWAFPIFLIAFAVAAPGLFFAWNAWRKEKDYKPFTPLQYLDPSWSFKDSWVSNVTIAAGLLTGIFGSSETLKAIIGDEAENSIAAAIVGAAIAAAFVGAGPIVLQSTMRRPEPEKNDGSPQPTDAPAVELPPQPKAAPAVRSPSQPKGAPAVTVAGLLLASGTTLAGGFGELWVVFQVARRLDMGGFEDRVWLPVAAAMGLLAVYAWRSTSHALQDGVTQPPAAPPSDEIAGATIIAKAIESLGDGEFVDVKGTLEELAKTPLGVPGTSPGDTPSRRRSAIL
jgi:hypothetical protein